MDFYIDKDVLDTPFYLLCRANGTVEKERRKPEDAFCVNTKEAWLLSKLYNFELPKFPSYKYVHSFKGLIEKDQRIPWSFVMPSHAYSFEVRKYVHTLQECFDEFDKTYYDSCYKPHGTVFESLKPAKINSTLFMGALKKNFGNHDSIKTFVPRKGYASKVFYDRLSSRTGRLIVHKGPNILNLKKDYRTIIESRFGSNGKIYYLDFSSVEPRVLLSLVSGDWEEQPEDIYQHILDTVGLKAPRVAAKIALLSTIYGGSEAVREQLKEYVDYPDDFRKQIIEYFGVDELRASLREEFENMGGRCIYNFYSRHIDCEGVEPWKLLNYYVQSTAADVCLWGYKNILDRVKQADLSDKIVPVFLLHDGIFLDIHNDFEFLVPKLCLAGSKNIYGFENTNFWLKVEKKWFIHNNQVVIVS